MIYERPVILIFKYMNVCECVCERERICFAVIFLMNVHSTKNDNLADCSKCKF